MNSYQWLSKLIAHDTTSRNSNLNLIAEIRDWLNKFSIETTLTYDKNKQKANLFGTLPAHNGRLDGGIILSGHTDVVPVDGQKWDTDPFASILMNDKIYGRGACDMKGFIAVVLALVPQFAQHHLAQPLHFAFSYDEEVGCKGAPLLIADFQQRGIQPKACIVGEPTEMRPVVAHKGINVFHCKLHGVAAHSSLIPQGCNAIDYAAELICHIHELAVQIKQEGPFDDYFDVPFSTISTNVISGGNAINTIPGLCEFFFEMRSLPGIKPQHFMTQIETYIRDYLLLKMRHEQKDVTIEFETIASAPSFEAIEEAEITYLVRKLTQVKDILKVAYATEAGLFQQAGIATIVCGPGSIEQAHRANEFVTLTQLNRCEDFLRNLILQDVR